MYMQKLYNADIHPDTHYSVSQFFGQEFYYTFQHEDAMPLIWLKIQSWACSKNGSARKAFEF
jgi:hypothetical protein